jgi:hypothetical protein
VILLFQRRFGKTSLVWKVLEEARKGGIIVVYVDLYPISTLGEFLEKIDIDHLRAFIKERSREARVDIDEKALELIMETTECHPYYTQYLCHTLYDIMEKRRIRSDDVPRAVDLLLRREATAYMNIWDLLTHRQRQALVALSETGPGESPFRAGMLRRFNISQSAVMIRALSSLIDKDLVDRENGRYGIIDLFFKRWIKTCIVQSRPFTAEP